jgi:hypothetical protein
LQLQLKLSQDLKQELPEATGLTQRNLYYCKKFYLLYNQANANLPQVGAEIQAIQRKNRHEMPDQWTKLPLTAK